MYFHCNSHKLFAQNFSLRGIVKRTTSGASSVPFPDSRKAAETFESPALIVWYTHTHLLQKEYKCSENRRQLFRSTKHKTQVFVKIIFGSPSSKYCFPAHVFLLAPLPHFFPCPYLCLGFFLRCSQAQDNILLFCIVLYPFTLFCILCILRGPASLKVFQTIPPNWV